MGGLIFTAVFLAWIAICFFIARRVTRAFKPRAVRAATAVLIFFAMLGLPVADEFMARPQLSNLCRSAAVVHVDAEKIKDKRIRVEISPLNQVISESFIPILHSRYTYRDATNGEALGYYDEYKAKGGFMSRVTHFPEGGHPWTFESALCGLADEGSLSKKYRFNLID